MRLYGILYFQQRDLYQDNLKLKTDLIELLTSIKETNWEGRKMSLI